jgi:hypothetical protein
MTREIANAIAADGDLTPLEFLTNVYRDANEEMSRRVDAAKAAAQYVHPKLSAVDLSASDGTLAEAAAYAWQTPQPSPR